MSDDKKAIVAKLPEKPIEGRLLDKKTIAQLDAVISETPTKFGIRLVSLLNGAPLATWVRAAADESDGD